MHADLGARHRSGRYTAASEVHDTPEVLYVSYGRLRLTADDSPLVAEADDLLLIPSLAAHAEAGAADTVGEAVYYSLRIAPELGLWFPSGAMNEQLQALLKHTGSILRLSAAEHPEPIRVFREIADNLDSENDLLLAGNLIRLLALLAPLQGRAENSGEKIRSGFLAELHELLGRTNPSQISLGLLASHFSYEKTYFSRLFHKKVGMSVSDFCTRYKIDYAKELIRSGNRNLTDVCVLSGFNHYTHFFQIFRRIVGVTPSDYIRQCTVDTRSREAEALTGPFKPNKENRTMNIRSRILSALVKVFETEDPISEPECLTLTALRGECVSFQIAYLADERGDAILHVDAPQPLRVTARTVEAIPSVYVGSPRSMAIDRDYLKTKSGKFPDCLRKIPEGTISFKKNRYRTVWFEAKIPLNATAQDYAVRVTLKNAEGEVLCDDTQIVTVCNADLPRQRLIHTEWFYADCIADFYGVDAFTPEHWSIVREFMKTAVKRGINMIYTPLFTPGNDAATGYERTTSQLIGVTRNNGEYSFDFTLLDQWIALAQECGMEYFEMGHLSSPGAEAAMKVIATVDGREEKIFNNTVKLPDAEFSRFISSFVPVLRKELERLDVLDHCYFHIADEPGKKSLPKYLYLKGLIAPHLAGCKIIDALFDPEFYVDGSIDIPVPCTRWYEPFENLEVPERWCYYSGACSIKTSNRFFSMRLARTRSIGIQLFKYRMDGFLHWGYNFYNSCGSFRHVNPYQISDCSNEGAAPEFKAFPSGDAFLVYPGPRGIPEESIRLLALEAGLNDLRVLSEIAARTSYEYAMSLVEDDLREPISFWNAPTSNYYYIHLRNRLNRELARLS